MKYLVKWEFDYADEFEVYGHMVYDTKEYWEKTLSNAKKLIEKHGIQEIYFGTNEYLEFYHPKDLDNYKIFEITDEEANTIIKYFDICGGNIDPYGRLSDEFEYEKEDDTNTN